jgi:hypothetical protein
LGWVEVDVARVVRREVVDRRVPVVLFAGLFRAVERPVVDLVGVEPSLLAGGVAPSLVVAIALSLGKLVFDLG